ncbi:S-adenosyl-L-methionine-dependent methyltransferase [Gaertneriomyces semiglobifer]|nr:S-adenosyl-L-methionine-dependent methyltransferase [Gaertneriomyces semiglobifer]
MEQLAEQEAKIDRCFLKVNNPVAPDGFYRTIIAMHHIITNKLFKARHRSLEDYLERQWNVSRGMGYIYRDAGEVTMELWYSIDRFDLPTNITLMITIKKLAKKHGLSYTQVWKKALAHFLHVRNVVAVHMKDAFMVNGDPDLSRTSSTPVDSAVDTSEASSTPVDSAVDTSEASSIPVDSAGDTSEALGVELETSVASQSPEASSGNPVQRVSQRRKRSQQQIDEEDDQEEEEGEEEEDTEEEPAFDRFKDAISTFSVPFMEDEQKAKDLITKGQEKIVLLLTDATSKLCERGLCCFLQGKRRRNNKGRSLEALVLLDSNENFSRGRDFFRIFREFGVIPNGRLLSIQSNVQMPSTLRYLSLFSGIGGAELAMSKVFPHAICVGFAEIDPDATKIYLEHFDTHKNLGDVKSIAVDQLPDFDFLIGGSPCQGFSNASSNRKNWEDERSTCFHDFVRVLKAKKPRWFLFENVVMDEDVQRLISKELGVAPFKLNSNNFSAQNRKRLYWCNWFVPVPNLKPTPLIDSIIEDDVPCKGLYRRALVGLNPREAPCAVTQGNGGQLSYRTDGKANTVLCAKDNQSIVGVNGKFRQLIISENERLQGFPKDWTIGVSMPSRRRLVGNAFQVDTVAYILSQNEALFQV